MRIHRRSALRTATASCQQFTLGEQAEKLGRQKTLLQELYGNLSGIPESRRLMLLQQTNPGPQAKLTTAKQSNNINTII